MTLKEKAVDYIKQKRMLLTFVMGNLFLVASAAAGELNTSITPILEDVVLLISPLLDLVVAIVPLILALAVVGLILGIFGAIVSRIKMPKM